MCLALACGIESGEEVRLGYRNMGRQWLHAKREVASLKKSKTTSKFVREISLAARQGADPALNARLAAALERARKESVSRDIIERAIQKGSGTGKAKIRWNTWCLRDTPHTKFP